jgi:hypothetical protein
MQCSPSIRASRVWSQFFEGHLSRLQTHRYQTDSDLILTSSAMDFLEMQIIFLPVLPLNRRRSSKICLGAAWQSANPSSKPSGSKRSWLCEYPEAGIFRTPPPSTAALKRSGPSIPLKSRGFNADVCLQAEEPLSSEALEIAGPRNKNPSPPYGDLPDAQPQSHRRPS